MHTRMTKPAWHLSLAAILLSALMGCSSSAQSANGSGNAPSAFESYWTCDLTEVDQGTTSYDGRMVKTDVTSDGLGEIWDEGPALSLFDWLCGGYFAISGDSAAAYPYTCTNSQIAVSTGTLSLSADGKTLNVNLTGTDGGPDGGATTAASLSGTCTWMDSASSNGSSSSGSGSSSGGGSGSSSGSSGGDTCRDATDCGGCSMCFAGACISCGYNQQGFCNCGL